MFYLCFGGTWVHVMTEKDLLKLIWIAENCFEIVALYLCLNGTWVFISTGNRLGNDFDKFLLFWGLQLNWKFGQFKC